MTGASLSSAQVTPQPATLAGIVVDPSGARVPHAAVHVHGQHLDRDTETSGEGTFDFRLPAGTYTLTVEAAGFRRLTKETAIAANSRRTLDLRLAIDVAEEDISVNPWSGSEDRTNSINFSGDQLDVLSSDPETLKQQLTALAGGGSGIMAPQFYVDGFSNGQVPPKSSIRAIHINNNPYSTLYDRPGFGRVEIETRAGGNKLHGMLDVGGTDQAFNSGNPFATVQPPYYQLLFRGNVSGPLHKSSSFFVGGNTSDLENNAIVNAVDPLGPVDHAVPNPVRDDDYSLRFDHQFSAANQINGRYEIHRTHQTNAGVGLLVLQSEGYASNSLTQILQLADSEIFNPRLVNDTRFQYVRSRTSQDPNDTSPTLIVQGALSKGGSPTQTQRDNLDQYEVQDNLTMEHTSHFIRAGMRSRFFRDSNSSNAGFNGQYVFPDIASYETGQPTQFSLTAGHPGAVVSTDDLAVYAEDEWKLTPSFTLNYGLRYETQSGVPDHNDPAPRLGFAWAIGARKTKPPIITLRGGAGLFYQRLAASDLLPSVRQNGINQVAYFVKDPAFYPSVPPPGSLSATEPTLYRLEPSLRTSRNLIASITAERAIGRIGSIAVNFLEADGRHAYLLTNANAPLPGTYNPADSTSGVRPLGGTQNIYQTTAEGTGHAQDFFTNINLNPRRWLYLFVFYVAEVDRSDANGTAWFASNSYDIRQDYGRNDGSPRQRGYFGGSINLPHGLAVRPFLSFRSGQPFNITTGTDLNGDTIYNDRPAFATDLTRPSVVQTRYGAFDTDPLPSQTLIPYNYGLGPGLVWVDFQMSEQLHIGPRPAAAAVPSPKAPRTPPRPWTLSFSLEVENLFNHTNATNPVGVLSSPLFGKSLSLSPDFSTLTAANRTLLLHSTFTF